MDFDELVEKIDKKVEKLQKNYSIKSLDQIKTEINTIKELVEFTTEKVDEHAEHLEQYEEMLEELGGELQDVEEVLSENADKNKEDYGIFEITIEQIHEKITELYIDMKGQTHLETRCDLNDIDEDLRCLRDQINLESDDEENET